MKYLTILFLALFASCNTQTKINDTPPSFNFCNTTASEMTILQNVYVPIYSNILHNNLTLPYDLTATLSIRNINFSDSIYIFSAKYYNTKGDAIKEYLQQPILMEGMESIDFVIEAKNKEGGLGANFVVQWGSKKTNNSPIIQAVMISTEGQQGISFVCNGVAIN